MNTMRWFRPSPLALSGVFLTALLLAGSLPARAQGGLDETSAPIQRHATQVIGAEHLLQQVFGPMPAIAGTPFLGLAVLSGAALLSDTDAVRTSDSAFVRGFHDNALIAEARRYSTLPLFLGLLTLSLLTWLTNSGKIRGALGKLLRAAEDSSVLVTYGLLALVTILGATKGTPAPRVAVVSMGLGVWSVPLDVLLAVGLAMAMAVMMTVRYAFDVIIWLSPFPLVDFGFETLKKLLSLGFLAIYFASPVVASSLGILVLVPAIFLYGWALRVLSFTFRIVLRPLLERIFSAPRPEIVHEHLRRRFAPKDEKTAVAIPVSALTVRGVRRRAPGALLRTSEGVVFVTSSPLRRKRIVLPARLVLARTLLWLELRAVDPEGPDGRVERIALPRTYAPDFEKLRAVLGAEDGGSLGIVRVFGQAAGPSTVPA
jgi:hypothetical protein